MGLGFHLDVLVGHTACKDEIKGIFSGFLNYLDCQLFVHESNHLQHYILVYICYVINTASKFTSEISNIHIKLY